MRIGFASQLLLPWALIACGPAMEVPEAMETPPPAPVADEGCPPGVDVGSCAPDFMLLNADGTPVSLSDRVGDRLVVVGSSLW